MELRAVQAGLRASIENRATTVGPFLVLMNDTSDNPFMNYAIPTDGAAPTTADVTTLVDFFTDRQRLPRLEYVRPAPAVDQALVAAGFDVAATLTLMAVDQPLPPRPNPEYRVELVTDDDRLRQVMAVQNIAYDEPTHGEPDPAGLRRMLANGGRVALAVHAGTGEPVGGGQFSGPQGGLVEVAAIGVLPAHRRRGVAALLTALLTDEAIRRDHEPFLQVEKDEPYRVYERLGYRVIGDMADARRH
jgi:GNAT superfamily N-acetyltransferase